MPRPPCSGPPPCVGPSPPASTSTARSRPPPARRRPRALARGARAAGSSTASCRTNSGCPGSSSCRRSRDRASSAGSSRCAASSATGSSRANRSRPAPLLELPQGGGRRHHHGHALPLAVRARQPLRRGQGGLLPRRDAHPAAMGRVRQALRRARPTMPPTPRSRLEGGIIAHFNSSWCVRVRRDDLFTMQVDGTHGSAVAGLRDCWIQPYGATPRPVWNPDVPSPIDYYASWQKLPEQRPVRQRLPRPVGTVPPARRPGRALPLEVCCEGAKGLQLAEAGLESSRRRSWVDLPELEAE